MDIVKALISLGPIVILFIIAAIALHFSIAGSYKEKYFNKAQKRKYFLACIGATFLAIAFFVYVVEKEEKIAEIQYGEGIADPLEMIVVEVTPTTEISQVEGTPSPTPITTPRYAYDISQDSGNLDVAEFVGFYFENINAAQNESDLKWGWDRLASNLQAASNNSFSQYADEWLKYRVKYNIFRCSNKSVDVEIAYYGKNDIEFIDEYTSIWIHYDLKRIDGNEWQFEFGKRLGDSYISDCSLSFNN